MEQEKIKKPLSKKKLKIIIIISAIVLTITSFFGGFLTYYLILGRDANSAAWIVGIIERTYCVYDEQTGEVKEFSAKDYAQKLTELLDKYSTYYTTEEYSDVMNTSKGNNYGIGVAFLSSQEDCKVYKVTGNSPAEKAGIKEGDTLVSVKVDGVLTEFTGKQHILDYLSALPSDKPLVFCIERAGTQFEATINKAVFITSYVKYYDSEVMGRFISEGSNPLVFTEKTPDGDIVGLDEQTAYISLSAFEGGAGDQIASALEYMRTRGRSKLILDLRDNGGGYMDVLSQIASYFTYGDNGKKCAVAIVKDKDGKESVYRTNGNYFKDNITKITVLANENTASASECLINAMLHYGRAFSKDNLVIERGEDGVARTFGKGIMQTTFYNIFTGEALKLTTAYVFAPDGKTTIHGKGIIATEANGVQKGGALSRVIAILA